MSLDVRKKKLIFKGLISIAFFSILASFVQGNQLVLIFSRVDWGFLLFSLALSPVMIVVSCLKWKMILDAGGNRVPFTTLFRIYLIGYFFSNMLPSTVGGDVVRSYYVGKIIQDHSYSAIAIFIERFSGIVFLFFLVLLTPLLLPSLYKSIYVLVPIAGAGILFTVIFWITTVKDPYKFLDRVISLVLQIVERSFLLLRLKKPQDLLKKISKYQQSMTIRLHDVHLKLKQALHTIRQDKVLLFKLLFITALFHFLTWVNVSLAFLTFGVEHQFLDICALVPTIMFVAHFPVTLLGNLGFFESVFVFYMLLIAIPATASLAMGLLLRLKMLLIGIVGFFVYIAYKQETGDDAKGL